MKHYFLFFFPVLIALESRSQNVGIGTATPAARLHVADSGVVFTGPQAPSESTPFAPPLSGIGTRMMWYPAKGAFRAGTVSGAEWDKENIGVNSIGMGRNVVASGEGAVSMGDNTSAIGTYSFCMGKESTASGYASLSMGWVSVATSSYSISMGAGNRAEGFGSMSIGGSNRSSGDFSTSIGNNNLSTGTASVSMGLSNSAIGEFSTSMGAGTTARAYASTSIGYGTIAKSPYSLVIGQYNDTSNADRIFEIGNGFSNGSRRNALTVLSNGNIGIGMTNPIRPLSFPATLEKKISFYPGATGDVGISVSGNDLQIYSDNVNARVSFGYDDYAAGFTSRAYVTASGSTALVVQGNMTVNGTNYNSDARFKQHIQPLTGSLEKINALQGVQYEMRTKEFPDRNFQSGTVIGLIAQEVEKVLPELVRTDADGYKSVDYAKLVPVLIEGMKAQQTTLSNQQRQLEIQQRLLDAQQQELEQLKKDLKRLLSVQ